MNRTRVFSFPAAFDDDFQRQVIPASQSKYLESKCLNVRNRDGKLSIRKLSHNIVFPSFKFHFQDRITFPRTINGIFTFISGCDALAWLSLGL